MVAVDNPAPEDLAFRARALAQAHPLSPAAAGVVDQVVEREGERQPLPEIGTWAGAQLVAGYCLRRVEETDAGQGLEPIGDAGPITDGLDEASEVIVTALRVGDPEPYLLGDPDTLFLAMNRIIDAEVDRRLHNFGDEIGAPDREEFEEYVTTWVVKGYAVRVAERELGTRR